MYLPIPYCSNKTETIKFAMRNNFTPVKLICMNACVFFISILCLSRVERLKKLVKKSNRAKLEKNKKEILEQNEDNDGSDDSDEDLNNIFDWRAKMA